jgi:large subunit ribosomal protein L32
MAVPKRKMSKTRTHTRRAHDALKPKSLAKCPRCSQALPPHTLCGNCGYYRGQLVVDMEAK